MSIDWTVFEGESKYTCYCNCNNRYRSYAKYVAVKGMITKDPCPKCNQHQGCYRIVSDKEEYNL